MTQKLKIEQVVFHQSIFKSSYTTCSRKRHKLSSQSTSSFSPPNIFPLSVFVQRICYAISIMSRLFCFKNKFPFMGSQALGVSRHSVAIHFQACCTLCPSNRMTTMILVWILIVIIAAHSCVAISNAIVRKTFTNTQCYL